MNETHWRTRFKVVEVSNWLRDVVSASLLGQSFLKTGGKINV